MLSYALFMSAVFLSESVSLHLVQSACAENPNLAFCDSHLLENFTPPPTQSTVTSEPLITSEAKNANRSNEETQFMAWLIDQNDEALNMEIDESERPQKHSSGKKYCSKYKDNFGMYCKKSNIESLEQVLQKFCTIYAHQCENHSDFPTPGPLLPSSESTTQDSDEDSTGYCHKFLAHFQKLCSINQQHDSKKTNEFCSTYRDRCQSSTLNDLVKDNEQIDDLPDSLEIDTTFQPRKEEDKKPESDISTYCEKYWENFNFYCAGQSTSGHEKFCESFRRNCPQKIGSLKESASFLGGKEKVDDVDGESNNGQGDTLYLYKGTREEYCNKFSVNFEYYCRGNSENQEITEKFCPSYKKSCKDRPPANPFATSVSSSKSSSEAVDRSQRKSSHSKKRKSSKRTRRQKKHKMRSNKRPCTADCDQRIYPHCTQACKCDYSYPFNQKFCNPPPLPLFLNTCRLWYAGCPKYERYHYASQFIYSKAEKGKKVLLPAGDNGEGVPGSNVVARDDPLNDNVDWATSIVLNQDDFEASTVEWPKNDTFFDSNGYKEQLDIHKEKYLEDSRKKDDILNDEPSIGVIAKDTPVIPSDSVFSNALQQYGAITDNRGVLHRPHTTSPFTKPGLWEANPDNPHNRDHSNKFYYRPESTNIDWMNGQLAWGGHYAVPAVGVGGTAGFSTVHFPSAGTFLNIPDDYD